MLATHLLDDIEGSAIAAMLRTIQILVLLADVNAAKRVIFRDYGLNTAQARQVASATPRRDLFYKTPQGSRLAWLDLDPAALAVCGCGGAALRRRAQEVMAQAGSAGFAAAWLRECDLDEEAEALETSQDASAGQHRDAATTPGQERQ